MRGGLHIGALQTLERVRGNLTFPDGLWGCSAGAVLATAIAFQLTAAQIHAMYMTHLTLAAIVPSPRLDSLANLVAKKGLFSMDRYEATLIEAFQSQGIDLRTKTIADAPQPLCIVASNLTTHNPVVFTKQVRILDALRCSSCIPIVFEPQVLYNHVYLDGVVFVDCMSSIAPPDALVLHISDPGEKLYARDIEGLTVPEYLHRVYRSMRARPTAPNVLWLHNTTFGILHDMTPEEKEALARDGASQTLAFLTKRFPDELKDARSSALPGEVTEERTGL